MHATGKRGPRSMKNFRVSPSGLRKILIIKPSSFGDVIHGLPVLHALSLRFPEAELHWVVAKGFAGILEGHPLIHRLWIIDKDSWKKPGNLAAYLFGDWKAVAGAAKREIRSGDRSSGAFQERGDRSFHGDRGKGRL